MRSGAGRLLTPVGPCVSWQARSLAIRGWVVHLENMPFSIVDWLAVPATEHPGLSGTATWRTRQLGDLRVRLVDYSAGYVADHWCSKGHVLLVIEGELVTELQSGESHVLTPLKGYHVADGETPHRSVTATGARLFIVD